MASPDLKFDVNTELAARRTGMSFQRTRMSADRTLMSVIRTSLSLIGFGFTIFQVFQKLRDQDVITKARRAAQFRPCPGWARHRDACPRHRLSRAVHAGAAPLARSRCGRKGSSTARAVFPVSLTLITALILLVIGVAAILSMAFHVGPFE